MPLRAIITQGTTADCTQAIALIDGFTAENLLADKGYDTDAIIEQAKSQGMAPVIPSKKNRKVQRDYDRELYKARHLVIAVRLRVKKKVQNLSAMWYKEFAKNFATQGDFGHESP